MISHLNIHGISLRLDKSTHMAFQRKYSIWMDQVVIFWSGKLVIWFYRCCNASFIIFSTAVHWYWINFSGLQKFLCFCCLDYYKINPISKNCCRKNTKASIAISAKSYYFETNFPDQRITLSWEKSARGV